MTCKYCGSSEHSPDDCRIRQKLKLAEMGVLIEHLFEIMEADSIEDAAEQIAQGLDNHDAAHPLALLRRAYGI